MPTYVLLFAVGMEIACIKNKRCPISDPEHAYGPFAANLILCGFTSLIDCSDSFGYHHLESQHTNSIHINLLTSNEKISLIIQVVALNWKWLFIYPEKGLPL